MNIGKYIELYSEDLRIKNYSNNTIQNYVSQVRCFLEYYNNVATKPSEISERQIKEYVAPKNVFVGKESQEKYNERRANNAK